MGRYEYKDTGRWRYYSRWMCNRDRFWECRLSDRDPLGRNQKSPGGEIKMSQRCIDFKQYQERVSAVVPIRFTGRVAHVAGLVIESNGPSVPVGDLCYIQLNNGHTPVPAEVVGFKGKKIILMPIGELDRISQGSKVIASGGPLTVGIGMDLMGRVIGGLGEHKYRKSAIRNEQYRSIYNSPPDPLKRSRIKEPIRTAAREQEGL